VGEIVRIGNERAPNEACGVILPAPGDALRRAGIGARVIELPNRSMSPRDSYELHGSDIVIELEDWLRTAGHPKVDSMVIWHTHPSGNIGPSRGDLTHKLGDLSYLVVSIDPVTARYQTTLF
jgi:proteasome lid subunit RPN8/RPN11